MFERELVNWLDFIEVILRK
ncbi:protein YpfM [Salmonella enterica]